MARAHVPLFIAFYAVNVVLAKSTSPESSLRWSGSAREEEVAHISTVGHAIEVLGNNTEIQISLLQVIQDSVGYGKHARRGPRHQPYLRKGRRLVSTRGHHDQPRLLLQRSRQREQERFGDKAGSFVTALVALNEQIRAAMTRRDMEATRCSKMEQKHNTLFDGMSRGVSEASAQTAAAHGELRRARMAAASAAMKIPELMENRRDMKLECDEQLSAMSGELQVALADASEVGKVLTYSPCGASAALLQKGDSRPNPVLSAVGSLATKTESTKQILDEVLHQLDDDTQSIEGPVSSSTNDRQGRASVQAFALAVRNAAVKSESTKRALDEVLLQLDNEVALGQVHEQTLRRNPNETTQDAIKRMTRITMNMNPTCDYMHDKVLRIKGETVDRSEQLQKGLADVQRGCEDAEHDFLEQIGALERISQDAQVRTAMAIAEQNQAQGRWKLMQDALDSASREYNENNASCSENLQAIQQEICSFQQVRGELGKLEGGGDPFFQDCEVSSWTYGECSVTCGGNGVQMLRRQVVAKPFRGAACLPLVLQQNCGHEPCPVDCELEDWGGWSECSSECGGGVRQRVRSIRLAPSGGRLCDVTVEAQSCNDQACDRECELAPWTDWSPCSKPCNGGVQQRTRAVMHPAVGLGTCPSSTGFYRLGHRVCSPEPCLNGAGSSAGSSAPESCAAFDIVLLVDGSAAMDSVSWYYMRQAGVELATSLTEGKDTARVAVLVFGGKVSSKCLPSSLGSVATETIDPIVDCGLMWLSRLSESAATVAAEVPAKLEALAQPAGSALLSEAFGAAEAELANGRQAAASIVVVLTPGKPVSAKRTEQAARQLKAKARVMVVPVTTRSDPWPQMQKAGRRAKKQARRRRRLRWRKNADMQQWPSKPLHNNFIVVKGYENLAQPQTIGRLAEEICPDTTADAS
mmetsp:Transcript_102722/g.257546  ORF Transcript_102722/g.257546 Transcript_102722/m.257546 type:complete len:923 (-) Transcript_102722:29-2797(-)